MSARKNEVSMSVDERLAVIETTMSHITSILVDMKHDINHQFERLDTKINDVDKKIDIKFDILDKKIDIKFDILDKKFDFLQNRLWTIFLWLIGMMIGLAGFIAHIQHWI